MPRSSSCKIATARSGTAVLIDDISKLLFAFELTESYDASASFPHLQPLFESPRVSLQLLVAANCLQFEENPFNQGHVAPRERIVNPTALLTRSQDSGLPTN